MGDDSEREEGFYRLQFIILQHENFRASGGAVPLVEQPLNSDCLFVFAENYHNFKTTNRWNDYYDMRQFNRCGEHKMRPRSCGLVLAITALDAFSHLDMEQAYAMIDESLEQVCETVAMLKYRRIILVGFSGTTEDRVTLTLLGVPAFVSDYINVKLTEMMRCYIKE